MVFLPPDLNEALPSVSLIHSLDQIAFAILGNSVGSLLELYFSPLEGEGGGSYLILFKVKLLVVS